MDGYPISQVAELTTVAEELQRVADSLEDHTPDGRCDDSCGCTTDRADSPTGAA